MGCWLVRGLALSKRQAKFWRVHPLFPANERFLLQKLYCYRFFCPHPHQKAAHDWWGCLKGRRKSKVRAPRFQPSAPSSVTVIQDSAGRCFAGFVVDVAPTPRPANGKAVGMDLGVASLAVTSEGEKTAPPKPTFLRSALKRLRRLQRRLSRKAKVSSNGQKARLEFAKAHATMADQRLDLLRKPVTGLLRENQTVALEDLNVSGLLKNRKLPRSIVDTGGRRLWTLLESKAEQYGREVVVIGRWLPTSQRCSTCGHHDAAVNNLAAEVAARLNACGAESGTGSPASGLEAETRLNRRLR